MKNQPFIQIRYFIFPLLLFSFSGVYSQVQTPKYVSISNHSRGYYEYLPLGYSSSGNQKYPLLIFAHGGGEIGDGSSSELPRVLTHGTPQQINKGIFPASFVVNGKTFRFIVISPQFDTIPDPSDMDQIINYSIGHYNVDINRIYLTGLSMGGGIVVRYPGYSLQYAQRIAAIVPVCGASTPTLVRCQNIAAADIAVWATHNNNDPVVPVSNTIGLVNTINGLSSPPNPLAKKTIFQNNTHDAWTQTYDLNFKENNLNVYEWMLQYSKATGTLPVSDLTFTAARKDDGSILLKWKTFTENNNRGFIIERSRDGSQFDSIAFVPGISINGGGADYQFSDKTFYGSVNYYRLKQVNFDNSYTYGPVKFVQGNNDYFLKVYPNPIMNNLIINTNYSFRNATLRIYNINGSLMLQSIIQGDVTIYVPVSKLLPGVYAAKIYDKNNRVEFRFVKN